MRQRRAATSIAMILLAGVFGAALLTNTNKNNNQPTSNTNGDRTPGSQRSIVILQDGKTNCGAAALAMILNHFGHRITLPELNRRIKTTPGGTSLQHIRQLANELGLQAKGWRLRQEELKRIQHPVILFLTTNHFVVADSLSVAGDLFVRDPAIGTVRIPQQALRDVWSGQALVFSRSPGTHTGSKDIIEQEQER